MTYRQLGWSVLAAWITVYGIAMLVAIACESHTQYDPLVIGLSFAVAIALVAILSNSMIKEESYKEKTIRSFLLFMDCISLVLSVCYWLPVVCGEAVPIRHAVVVSYGLAVLLLLCLESMRQDAHHIGQHAHQQ